MHKGCRRVPRSAYHGLTRGACRTALLLMLASWLGGCDANQVTSAITCSGGGYPSDIGWSLSCSDDTTLSGGAPYTSSVPLAVALGATSTLNMTDSYGDGWNGAEWAAPGFGQNFSLASGPYQGTGSFVVQFQPPPSPPSLPNALPCTYALMRETLPWAAADAACQAAGLQLASVQSAAQNVLLLTAASASHPHHLATCHPHHLASSRGGTHTRESRLVRGLPPGRNSLCCVVSLFYHLCCSVRRLLIAQGARVRRQSRKMHKQ